MPSMSVECNPLISKISFTTYFVNFFTFNITAPIVMLLPIIIFLDTNSQHTSVANAQTHKYMHKYTNFQIKFYYNFSFSFSLLSFAIVVVSFQIFHFRCYVLCLFFIFSSFSFCSIFIFFSKLIFNTKMCCNKTCNHFYPYYRCCCCCCCCCCFYQISGLEFLDAKELFFVLFLCFQVFKLKFLLKYDNEYFTFKNASEGWLYMISNNSSSSNSNTTKKEKNNYNSNSNSNSNIPKRLFAT